MNYRVQKAITLTSEQQSFLKENFHKMDAGQLIKSMGITKKQVVQQYADHGPCEKKDYAKL